MLQIGKPGPSGGSNDTSLLGRPADIQVDDAAREVFVADGYGNRRVIVFDSETGAYKRHWGAYGNKPNDDKQPAYDPAAPPSQQFGNPVHCAKPRTTALSTSATAPTTASRCSRRTAPSSPSGSIDKSTLGAGSVWDLDFWPDANQTWLFNVDGENNFCASCSAATAKWSAASAARAARPATSIGSTTSPSIPKATSTRPKSTTESACRSSSRTGRRR